MTGNEYSMKCPEFAELAHELDRPGSKGYERREAALNHAESCGTCAVLLMETESLDFALGRIASEAAREVASSRVESALLQEFRHQKSQVAKQRMKWQAVAIGAAAAVFLALGLWLQHFGFSTRRVNGTAATVVAETNSAVAPASPSQAKQDVESKSKTQAIADLDADSEDPDLAQGFTPLPYSDDPSMIEGGSVVRVILSRSALASFGVSLAGAESADQIPADLVVSEDGTPEAIRLVAQND